jgi:urease accessory protein
MNNTATLLLLADSRFPTGAHAHSAGIEASHARGDIRTVHDLAAFLDGRLLTIAPVEAAFAAAACATATAMAAFAVGADAVSAQSLRRQSELTASAASAENGPGFGSGLLVELDHELQIRTPSPRLRQISRSLGRQLLRPAERAWPSDKYASLRAMDVEGPMQPIALGVVAAAAGLTPLDAALCSLHHLVGAATTAAVRLLGLDPFDVHALAARTGPTLDQIAAEAARLALTRAPHELPATTSLLADILAEHHATWEVRLFAS